MIKKIIKKVLLLALILGVLGFGLDRLLDVNDFRECIVRKNAENVNEVSGDCKKVDAVVVISGGDTGARTRYAASLVEAGLAPILITSGDSAESWAVSNAEEMRDIAVSEFKIASAAILMDKQSRNTNENAKYVRQIIDEYNEANPYTPINSMVLVTSGYHQARAYREFRAKFPVEFQIYNAPVAQDKDWSKRWYLSPRGWYLAIKESAGLLITPRS